MRTFLGISAVVAVFAAASTAASAPRALCRVTGPNDRVPYGAPRDLYGNGQLATSAYLVIYADARTRNGDGTISEKFPWWGGRKAGAELRVTGKRLDAAAAPLRARVNPGVPEQTPRPAHFWATGITFPTTGCWRIDGRAGRVRLSLVVRVVDR